MKDEILANGNTSESLEASCQWDKTYSLMPDDMECVVTSCDNPDMDPTTNGLNYNFYWDGELVPINDSIVYTCNSGHYHEQDVTVISISSIFTQHCQLLHHV